MPNLTSLERIKALPAKSQLEVWQRIDHLARSGVTATPEMLTQIIDRVEATPTLTDEQEGAIRRSYLRHPRETDHQVVYYLRFADRVKIGTSSNLSSRLTVVPHDELLATEPGGYALERQRHKQFKDQHITGEWFTLDDVLAKHIAALT